jgi:hypothetical protein
MGKGQCPLFKPHYLLQKIYAAGPYIHKIPSRKSPHNTRSFSCGILFAKGHRIDILSKHPTY